LPEGDEGKPVDDGVLAEIEALVDERHPGRVEDRASEQEERGEQTDALDQRQQADPCDPGPVAQELTAPQGEDDQEAGRGQKAAPAEDELFRG
jgi:hypothetical protein